jgi:hypothetical protein
MNTLLRMVYVSTTTNPVNTAIGGVQKDIGRILMQARKNNPAQKIGGVLYFSNNYFFQCLEGEQEAVNCLYNKILADPRHKNVQSVSVKRINKRQFANWSMKYVASEDKVTRLLRDNGFTTFNPYDFDENMIDKMLGLFTTIKDVTAQADQNYDQSVKIKPKQGLLSRLLNRKNAA